MYMTNFGLNDNLHSKSKNWIGNQGKKLLTLAVKSVPNSFLICPAKNAARITSKQTACRRNSISTSASQSNEPLPGGRGKGSI